MFYMASAPHPWCGCLYPVYYVETQNLSKPNTMMLASMVEVPPNLSKILRLYNADAIKIIVLFVFLVFNPKNLASWREAKKSCCLCCSTLSVLFDKREAKLCGCLQKN